LVAHEGRFLRPGQDRLTGGITVIFVTHDIEEAVYLSDRVVLLSGSPARATAEYRIALPRPRHRDQHTMAYIGEIKQGLAETFV